jgi:D-alanine-D-alanine ligase
MRVLVLLGGYSAERDVSYASGMAVARALADRKHRVCGLDPALGQWFEDEQWHRDERDIARTPPGTIDSQAAARTMTEAFADLRLRSFDVIFVALHGGAGEDGTVQTLLGLTGVPYTGSGPLSSGVAMHKDTTKRLLRQAGIPTPDWIFPCGSDADAVARLGLPLIVKPVAEGSTVGLSLVKTQAELGPAVSRAGAQPMFEAFVAGREFSVPILGTRALPPVEVVPDHEIYDYECKYTDGMTEFKCPAPLDSAQTETMSQFALQTFEALGCAGFARADFRLTKDGTLYCLEMNTVPGMTSHSLVPMAAAAVGIDFGTLCEQICNLALEPRGS